MKKIKTLLVLLLFAVLASQTYAQHAMILSGGKYYPSKSADIYLSQHSILQLGYQYSIKEQLSIQASLGGNLLQKNTDYYQLSESNIPEYFKFMLSGMDATILYSSLFAKLEVGGYLLPQSVIQPFAFTGVSWNYIYHSYTDVSHITSSSISFDQIEERKQLLAYHLSTGAYIKITDRFKIQLSADYAFFYQNKVGVQQLQLNTYNFQVGFLRSL